MTAAVQAAYTDFSAIVGESRVVADPVTRVAYAVDGRTPEMVVLPPAAEQVAAVLKCAADRGLAVIPCRNATKLEIGNPPRRYDVALCLKEMNRVWYYEPADLTVSVEPGMKFADFQNFLARHGLWLPLDPPAGARASLGGILATNSAGPLRLCYGSPRDMVLGIRIATPEGKIIKTGGRVVKNVAGYDLAKLLVGSYGTLGVIVEANLKLYPLPAERATFMFSTGTLGIAQDIRRKILLSPLQPLRLALLNDTFATQVRAGSPLAREVKEFEIWVEAGGSERVIARYAREFETMGREVGAAITRPDAETAGLLWTRLADFRASLASDDPEVVVLKSTLPLGASEELLSRAQQEAESEKVRLASVAQVGAGILHLVLSGEKDGAAMVGLIERLRSAAESLGGALVVEDCPSALKERLDVWGKPGDDFEVMRKLKLAWDPKGTLSPGRFLGGL